MSEKSKEFWRWREYRHTMPDMDWQDAKMVTAGVDIGSVGSKAVVMLDGKLYAYAITRTGGVSEETAIRVMNWALEGTGLKNKNVHYVVGTGYGRVNVPFAKRTIRKLLAMREELITFTGLRFERCSTLGGRIVRLSGATKGGRLCLSS